MKISVIWKLSRDEKKNEETKNSLAKALEKTGEQAELLVYPAKDKQKNADPMSGVQTYVCQDAALSDALLLKDAATRARGDFVTFVSSGDTLSAGSVDKVLKAAKDHKSYGIFMLKKELPGGEPAAFARDVANKDVATVDLEKKFHCHPFYFGGTFIKRSLFKEAWIKEAYGLEAERGLLLNACLSDMKLVYIKSQSYKSGEAREGDLTFFKNLYQPDWYIRTMDEFWVAFLQEIQETRGQIPQFIQYNAMFSIRVRMLANQNNKNKHAIEEGKEEEALRAIGRVLQYIDDDIMYNCIKLEECILPDSMKWVLAILKKGKGYTFDKCYVGGDPFFYDSHTVFNRIQTLRTNIQFMNYEKGFLEIDGTVHPILRSMADEVFFMFNEKKYTMRYNKRYAHTKVYGISIYKESTFHMSLPMEGVKNAKLFCFANFGRESVKIHFNFESHTSRISGRFANNYWVFGKEKRFMMEHAENGLLIHPTWGKQIARKEWALQKEMFKSHSKRAWLFMGVRLAYFAAKPWAKKRPIWMYLDKIYKGGDSSEYLYRYASKQDNNFRHYYLIDKKTSDYKRLKAEGFKPLVRGGIKHHLIFLLADMMVISNSTVFTFNNFGMVNSSYIRDLVDFHVVCVQHGMSVQKIAVAQNRLRDNTRLYFCASKYEIQNLMHPVYDYMDYHALKLTGVPRYDGLVNDDKKQIMISPTWRMQAAVPVRTSEGEQRDYNPRFKETDYFKVFNALVNDPRLIEAAKKYGYRIKYVLHPIVSAQVDDFDKNDYVDIIPAVGDMSYERMFCESSLMVTDYSGIQFDFAYMRKPLVYLHHKDIPQHYEEGSFFYDTMAFGEICHDNDELIDLLCEYMADGCVMKPEYVKRADDFFYYDDHNNCKRIYDEMIDYQESHILHPVETVEKEKAITTITECYYDIPLDEKKIVLLGLGKHVRGNLQYILDELNHSDRFEGYTVYVRTSPETHSIVNYYIIVKQWKRTIAVKDDREYSRVMESAKYLLTEVFFPESWVKKEGQVLIDIWHGTPLKKLGLAKNATSLHHDGNTQRNFINADYLLYPNEYTRDHMLESYKVADLMPGKSLLLGYPRTGGMLKHEIEDQADIRRILAPNGERVYAYMPTWKAHLTLEQVIAESKELLDYLDENLADDQIMYVNLHHKVSDVIDYSVFKKIKKFPATVDSYALLAATDALLTDYSSVFYDYLAMRKHIVLYCPDYEIYMARRGTYMDLSELPFDKAMTKEEVLEALNRGKTYDDAEAYERFCAYDSAENARKLCSLMLEKPDDDLDIRDIEKSNKKQIMLYTEDCGNVAETAILTDYMYHEQEEDWLSYVGCEMNETDRYRKLAYPMFADYPVIGTEANYHLTGAGKSARENYVKGRLSFTDALEVLEREYALVPKRFFGRAAFDLFVIWDVYTPDLLMSLAQMEAKKVLVVSGRMCRAVKAGDAFLKDALVYTAAKAETVWRTGDADEALIKELFGQKRIIPLITDAGVLASCIRENV